MSPWKAGEDGKQGHHILPKHEQKKALGDVYDETKIRLTPEDHQKIHEDEKEVGPYGSLVRQEKREALRGSKNNKLF
ncbi:MAG: hypothetical protein Q7J73_07995 [Dehalococcoidales bacterium]|nr:hypothetical protein [Dehalococcoidales bacterium]